MSSSSSSSAPVQPSQLLSQIISSILTLSSNEPKSQNATISHLGAYASSRLHDLLTKSLFVSIKSLSSKHQLSALFSSSSYHSQIAQFQSQEVYEMWDEFVKFMFMGAYYVNREEYRIGSLCLTKALERFCDKIWDREAHKAIMLKDLLMEVVALCVRYAKMGDMQHTTTSSGQRSGVSAHSAGAASKDCNNALATVLMTLRNKTGRDRADKSISKKVVMLPIINYQFLIYFRIDNINMCETILIQIDGTNLFYPFQLEDYSTADQVTFDYYAGRVKLFTSEYAEASERLMRAFTRTPRRATQNKKLILRNLICVNLMMGRYPPKNLLAKYNMQYYEQLVRACATGNLKTLFAELDKHQSLWMKNGTYLLLERTKIIAYRNFLRRVCKVISSGDWRFELDKFRVAFKVVGLDMDENEVEGIVSNLIYQGYISGYISHAHQKLVTAKSFATAFPKIQNQYKKLI
eukprot:CAMPEP_0117445830 /NCGR_PEP_ID=MMETSP0759-20121206/6009_1 /TAXON_ID=63605 /ORGANISM="Percolomonas cosmopolitus, Strain WS" /LENGTH=462 /DNA_ID=CAMNT_0005238041 /DNA_START=13 /DNA_END=1404 /DNA_ORIENTATION=-